MKLGKIENLRCGEPSASTYVVAPDWMSEEEFKGTVRRAVREYETVMAETPLYQYDFPYFPSHADFRGMPPEKTVGDVLREVEETQQRRKEAQAQAERKRRSFGYYLEQEGLLLVQRSEMTFTTTADWGHRHGQIIRYDGLDFFLYDPFEDEEGNEKCLEKESA